MAGHARGVGRAAMEPVKMTATAAPAITALDGFMLVLAFVPVFGMFLFLSLQHKCDGAVGFISTKTSAGFCGSQSGNCWRYAVLSSPRRAPSFDALEKVAGCGAAKFWSCCSNV